MKNFITSSEISWPLSGINILPATFIKMRATKATKLHMLNPIIYLSNLPRWFIFWTLKSFRASFWNLVSLSRLIRTYFSVRPGSLMDLSLFSMSRVFIFVFSWSTLFYSLLPLRKHQNILQSLEWYNLHRFYLKGHLLALGGSLRSN